MILERHPNRSYRGLTAIGYWKSEDQPTSQTHGTLLTLSGIQKSVTLSLHIFDKVNPRHSGEATLGAASGVE
jgi:hypothetical protein